MEVESKTAIVILSGSVLIIILLLLVVAAISIYKRKVVEVENQKQLALFRITADVEQNQRVELASRLHNEIVPVVSLLARSLNSRLLDIESKGVDVSELKKEIVKFGELSEALRAIGHGLVPQLFNTFGLLTSLGDFIERMNYANEAVAEFNFEAKIGDQLPFAKNDQLIIFNICLEILNNLNKHAKYELLKVYLGEMNDNFKLVFAHDGIGITNLEIEKLRESGRGIGLKLMESKALLINAQIDYSTEDGISFVKLIVPIK